MKRFTKGLFALFLSGASVFTAHARSVDESTAKNVGANFLIAKGVAGVSGVNDLATIYTASSVVGGNTITAYYVFNINGGNGFVMVSADDNIIPILAFSYESSFDLNHMAPATKDWINGYKNEIAAAITHNVPAKSTTPGLWADLESGSTRTAARVTHTTAVSPLVTTTWDQAPGYNNDCPNTATTGGRSVTGCVATAMAQVMKFWNWPTVGCGYHTYYDAYNASEGSGSNSWNSANFGTTAYDWSAMPLASSNSAVALLMYHAGVGVNMSYSANESGSLVTLPETVPVNCAEYALKTYFHYAPSLHSLLRDGRYDGSGYYTGPDPVYYNGIETISGYSETTWIGILQAELNAGRPMLYEGQAAIGGHCWVCDGWEVTSDMFHFNWGWSGMSDGYYTVDNLAPPSLGVGAGSGSFNTGQGIVMGIQPDTFLNSTNNLHMLAFMNNTVNTPMDYGTPFSITTKVLNSGTSTFKGTLGVQLYDTSTNLVEYMDSLTGITITAGDSTAVLTFNCSPYAVTPYIFSGFSLASRATGSGTWTPIANNGSFINYGAVGVLNDTDVVLFDSLHISSHKIARRSALTVTTTIGNQGNLETGTGNPFNGTLEAILVNTSNGDTFLVEQLPSGNINPGYQNNFTFTNSDITVAPGLYALEIKHQYGSGSFYTTSSDYYRNPELITVVAPASVPQTSAVSADIEIYPNPASDNLNITITGADVSVIDITDIQGRIVKMIRPAGQSAITVPVSDLAPGVYMVASQTSEGIVTKKVTITK